MFAGRSKQGSAAVYEMMKSEKTRKKLGLIEYVLTYDYVGATITMEVLQIKDLNLGRKQPKEKEMSCYLRAFLLPDLSSFKESSIKSKSFSPVFNESYSFKCVLEDLDSRKILIRVYQHFKLLRDTPIGDGLLELSKSDLQLGYNTLPIYSYNPGLDDPLGEICLSLRYNANTNKLGVTVIECKNLKSTDWSGLSDPYVKLTMRIANKVVAKEKTHVMKDTLNPYFNVPFSFKVTPNKLALVDLLVQVKDRDILGSNQEIGAVRFGLEPDSETAEVQWDNMINNLKKPQTEWHFLLPSKKD